MVLNWDFLVDQNAAKALTGPEGSWEWAGRFKVCCQTDSPD